MAMIRKEGAGDYQIGIYRVCRHLGTAAYPWAIEDRDGQILDRYKTLAEAYEWYTGEPLRQAKSA